MASRPRGRQPRPTRHPNRKGTDMTQKARPIADVFTGGWTPTPLSAPLNELPFDDTTYVSSNPNLQGDRFEVALAPLVFPDWGAQTLTVRLREVGAGGVPVTIALIAGDTVIAAKVVQPG